MLSIFLPGILHAHDNIAVHPWLAEQAFYVWPNDTSHEIYHYLGLAYRDGIVFPDPRACANAGDGKKITEGAKEEDDYDPIKGVCNIGSNWAPTEGYRHHFYDPDINSSNNGLCNDLGALAYAYTATDNYWKRAKEFYLAGIQAKNAGNTTLEEENKGTAYWYLGRIAHLLADASVPAHVHIDPHPPFNGDSYEQYMESNYASWTFQNVKNLQNIDTSWTVTDLFVNLAQRSQYFPSDDKNVNTSNTGDWFNGWPTNPNSMREGLLCIPIDSLNICDLDDSTHCSINDNNTFKIGDNLIPLAIQYTAQLYKLFWETTHDDSYEDNDSLNTAAYIQVPFSNTSLQCYDDDWYEVWVSSSNETINVTVNFIHSNGDIDIALYNQSGTLLQSSTSATNQENISYTTSASGYYYIKVYGYNGAKNLYGVSVHTYTTTAPDLQGKYFNSKASTVVEGAAFWSEVFVYNAGLSTAGSSHVRLYLSTDNDWDVSDDFYIGEKTVPALAPETGTWIHWDFNMPNIGAVGYNVWLVTVVDSWGEVNEGMENNTWKTIDEPHPNPNFTAYDVLLPLGEAVDNVSLSWSTGGDGNWFGQTADAFYGGGAVRSGPIFDNQTSWIRTTVTGPGSLSFYWGVSSEEGYDKLKFYIDGVEQTGGISGYVDWQLKTYSIGSGSHTLEWGYSKDGSVSNGSDAGWLDKVVWTPTPINGVCGSSSGGTYTTKPSTNLCSAGTATTVSGSGPWSWSCTGSNGGTTANCSANIQTWTVTPSAGTGGSISPNTPQTVNHGLTKSFTVTPNAGYTATVEGTCGGTPTSGTTAFTYTTNAITANCTVTATFNDITPPDTTITNNPATLSNTNVASFTFTSTEANSTFQCQLDGGTYGACTSPKTYTGLADASHTFSVKATDAAGNTDSTPANYTWIVDTTPPIPDISINPPSLNFRSVNIGKSSIKAVTISNTGTADLVIGTIEITGTDASEFSILNDACSGQTIASSGTCSVDVRFSPASGIPERFSMAEYFRQAMSLLTPTGYKQTKSAILSIPSNDPDTPTLNVPLSGKGYSTMMQRILDIQKLWQRSLFPSAGK